MTPARRLGQACSLGLSLFLLSSLTPVTGQAQQGGGADENAAKEQACAAVDLAQKKAGSRQDFEKAMWSLQSCRMSGGAKLVDLWRSPPSDSGQLELLGWFSAHYSDARVLNAALDVASNRSQPRLVRLAALKPLVYYVGRYVPLFREFRNGEVDLNGQFSHNDPHLGAQPLPSNVKEIVLAKLAELGSRAGEDEYIAAASKQLHWSLSRKK